MSTECSLPPLDKFPLGQRLALLGHFVEPMTLEAVRFMGKDTSAVSASATEHPTRRSLLLTKRGEKGSVSRPMMRKKDENNSGIRAVGLMGRAAARPSSYKSH